MTVNTQYAHYLARTVIGPTGRAYDCTTLASLERHLIDLSTSVTEAEAKRDVVLARRYRIDQDRLLDRREWVVATA